MLLAVSQLWMETQNASVNMGKIISFRSVYIRIWAKSSIFPVCKNSILFSEVQFCLQGSNFVSRGPILFVGVQYFVCRDPILLAGDQFCLQASNILFVGIQFLLTEINFCFLISAFGYLIVKWMHNDRSFCFS